MATSGFIAVARLLSHLSTQWASNQNGNITKSLLEVLERCSKPSSPLSPTDDHRPPTPTVVAEVMCVKPDLSPLGGRQVGQEEGGAGWECEAYLPMGPGCKVKCLYSEHHLKAGCCSVASPPPSPTDNHRPPTPTIVVEVMCGEQRREAFGTCVHITGLPPTPTIIAEMMCGERRREAFGTCVRVAGLYLAVNPDLSPLGGRQVWQEEDGGRMGVGTLCAHVLLQGNVYIFKGHCPKPGCHTTASPLSLLRSVALLRLLIIDGKNEWVLFICNIFEQQGPRDQVSVEANINEETVAHIYWISFQVVRCARCVFNCCGNALQLLNMIQQSYHVEEQARFLSTRTTPGQPSSLPNIPAFNCYQLVGECECHQLHHLVEDLACAMENIDARRDDDFHAKALASHLYEDLRCITIEGDDTPNPLVAQ
ncbi:hypothetical protein EI94DRAFT_1698107 [Lactarius quietus]|nr:hypothetical protein EI94DRAFT_1698107 [Lactarius quietus]